MRTLEEAQEDLQDWINEVAFIVGYFACYDDWYLRVVEVLQREPVKTIEKRYLKREFFIIYDGLLKHCDNQVQQINEIVTQINALPRPVVLRRLVTQLFRICYIRQNITEVLDEAFIA